MARNYGRFKKKKRKILCLNLEKTSLAPKDRYFVDCLILPLAVFFKWMRSFLFCLYVCRYMIYYKDHHAFWWSFWWICITYVHTVGKTYMTMILSSREKLVWLLFFYSVLHVYIDTEQFVLLYLGSTVKHSYNDDAYNKLKLYTAKPVSSISLIVKLYLELIW